MMGVFEQLQAGMSRVSQRTKTAYDSTKIELKIRSYTSEAEALFMEIGKIAYCHKEDMGVGAKAKMDALFHDLDNIEQRIKSLEKSLSTMKQEQKEERTVVIAGGSKNYTKLSKKVEDLTLKRTSDGIRILRFCPECRSENGANDLVCVNCGYQFRPSKKVSTG